MHPAARSPQLACPCIHAYAIKFMHVDVPYLYVHIYFTTHCVQSISFQTWLHLVLKPFLHGIAAEDIIGTAHGRRCPSPALHSSFNCMYPVPTPPPSPSSSSPPPTADGLTIYLHTCHSAAPGIVCVCAYVRTLRYYNFMEHTCLCLCMHRQLHITHCWVCINTSWKTAGGMTCEKVCGERAGCYVG